MMSPIGNSTAFLLLAKNVLPDVDVYVDSAYECSSSHSSRCKYRRSFWGVRIVGAATGDPRSHR